LSRAAEQLTSDYKAGNFGRSLATPELRAAYLLTRLPATYAANQFVFEHVRRLTPEFQPRSLADLGGGPGTASWAASLTWPSIERFAVLEQNREMMEVGRRIANASGGLKHAEWMQGDLQSAALPAADVVVLSYAIGELANPMKVVQRAWSAASEMLVVVEPGVPRNFETVARVRRELIEAGAHAVAPCPDQKECPMYAAGDWCHFAVRLERSSEHRRLKGGALGYEDEKFSYLAFSKQPQPHAASRIVRHPLTHPGHIKLTLCTAEGLVNETVTKSNKSAFREARRAKWGDEWTQLE
jgi:ribosomal protein RSM22 (predicted rRNA methylase)